MKKIISIKNTYSFEIIWFIYNNEKSNIDENGNCKPRTLFFANSNERNAFFEQYFEQLEGYIIENHSLYFPTEYIEIKYQYFNNNRTTKEDIFFIDHNEKMITCTHKKLGVNTQETQQEPLKVEKKKVKSCEGMRELIKNKQEICK